MAANLRTVRGFVKPGYESVRSRMQGFFDKEGWELGSSLVAYVGGEQVVCLSGGVVETVAHGNGSEEGVPRPYSEHTLQLVASSTKFISSVCIAMLVDRGLVSYGDSISSKWPAFAVCGKEHITLAQLMAHQAGLAALDSPLTEKEFESFEEMGHKLARQELNWPVPDMRGVDMSRVGILPEHPAPPQGYHGITRDLYASQV